MTTPSISPMDVNDFVASVYPAAHATGFRCDDLGEGFAVARWTYDPSSLRPGDLISGPTLFTVADIALWHLSFTVLGLKAMAVTSDIHITFLRPAAGGDVIGRAELLRAGRTRISGQVRIWVDGAEHRPVAHAVGGYGVLS
ncbi:MAG: PaaI family thioesterase [Acidimicrobiia bacterium]